MLEIILLIAIIVMLFFVLKKTNKNCECTKSCDSKCSFISTDISALEAKLDASKCQCKNDEAERAAKFEAFKQEVIAKLEAKEQAAKTNKKKSK